MNTDTIKLPSHFAATSRTPTNVLAAQIRKATSELNAANSKPFSHGQIAMLDSFLRFALSNQQEAFPLSVALKASAAMKYTSNRKVYERGVLVLKANTLKQANQHSGPKHLHLVAQNSLF